VTELEAKTKINVDADERAWTGFDEWVAEKKAAGVKSVTKAETLEFLRKNEVKVEEKVLGGKNSPANDAAGNFVPMNQGAPKFASYQTPGGENYRELLLTLPEKALRKSEGPNDPVNRFRSAHYDEPNILAHVRFNDRTDAAGKKVLFLEEIQSDWAQEGKKEGFGKRTKDVIDKEMDANIAELGDQSWSERPDLTARQNALQTERNSSPVALAPFVTSTEKWTGLALRRMVRWAAENGYDRVAWTTGEMQAARYDLSKQVDSITWYRHGDGYRFKAKKDGGILIEKQGLTPDELKSYIGKDAAAKITGNEEQTGTLSGLDLKVGGEGMKGYYDKIVPAVAGKIGKPWGVKVGETMIETEKRKYDDHVWGEDNDVFDTVPVPFIEITPRMRRSIIKGGMPVSRRLFRSSEDMA
jgi:hypothetical protein